VTGLHLTFLVFPHSHGYITQFPTSERSPLSYSHGRSDIKLSIVRIVHYTVCLNFPTSIFIDEL
jgi:hypothetical protein